ncbi:hypothetical protein GCM10010522_30600 [Kribbella solani]
MSFADKLADAHRVAYFELALAGVLVLVAITSVIKAKRLHAEATGSGGVRSARKYDLRRVEAALTLASLRDERNLLRPEYEELKRRGYRAGQNPPEQWAAVARRWAEVNAEIEELRSELRDDAG